jgi:hypothetical protein
METISEYSDWARSYDLFSHLKLKLNGEKLKLNGDRQCSDNGGGGGLVAGMNVKNNTAYPITITPSGTELAPGAVHYIAPAWRVCAGCRVLLYTEAIVGGAPTIVFSPDGGGGPDETDYVVYPHGPIEIMRIVRLIPRGDGTLDGTEDRFARLERVVFGPPK